MLFVVTIVTLICSARGDAGSTSPLPPIDSSPMSSSSADTKLDDAAVTLEASGSLINKEVHKDVHSATTELENNPETSVPTGSSDSGKQSISDATERNLDFDTTESTRSTGISLQVEEFYKSSIPCVISNDTQYSWLVKIVSTKSNTQVCTGTLITDEDVLIPASCFIPTNEQTIPESFYELHKELIAIAGGGIDNDCKQIRNISVIYPHKGYFTHESNEHDYAFIKVTPEFDVDDDNIPDLRYHLDVINSEGGLVNIHNQGPFCESPFFVDDGLNARVSDDRHLLGMRIEDCMASWNCSADFDTCLDYLHPATYACLKPLTPRNCTIKDRGSPLICNEVFHGYLDQCSGDMPMIFRGLNKAIKFLELEDDHVQVPGYLGPMY